jgi:hypothetical protein
MPHMGVSTEWVEEREDEMARLINACDQLDRLRTLGHVLYQREMVTESYYRDYRDSLDCIASALTIARRNTAILRNGGA